MDKLIVNITKFDNNLESTQVMSMVIEPGNDVFPAEAFEQMCSTYCNKYYPRVLLTIEPINKTYYTKTLIVSTFKTNCIHTDVKSIEVKKVKA